MLQAPAFASHTPSNRFRLATICVSLGILLALASACRREAQDTLTQGASSEAGRPKPDLLAAFGEVTLCPEPNAESLGLVVFPKKTGVDATRCNQQIARLSGLGVFRHDRGCSSPQKILASSQLARLLGNEHLFARATAVSLSRQEAASITNQAALTAPRNTAPKWVLLTTFLRSEKMADGIESKQGKREREEKPNHAATIEGVFVHAQESSEPFSELRKADRSSKPSNSNDEWAAFDTVTWENLTNRSARSNDSPRYNVSAAVQQAELMGDLADIVIIGAIRGGINNDAQVETIKFDYFRGSDGIVSRPMNLDEQKTGSVLQRIQIRDAACQQSDPQEFILRLRTLNHLRYTTYQRITNLSRHALNPSGRSPNAVETSDPLESSDLNLSPEMQRNLQEVASVLYRKCMNNRLHFDLELNEQLPASAGMPARRYQCNIVTASR
jgi:hypothetical protein